MRIKLLLLFMGVSLGVLPILNGQESASGCIGGNCDINFPKSDLNVRFNYKIIHEVPGQKEVHLTYDRRKRIKVKPNEEHRIIVRIEVPFEFEDKYGRQTSKGYKLLTKKKEIEYGSPYFRLTKHPERMVSINGGQYDYVLDLRAGNKIKKKANVWIDLPFILINQEGKEERSEAARIRFRLYLEEDMKEKNPLPSSDIASDRAWEICENNREHHCYLDFLKKYPNSEQRSIAKNRLENFYGKEFKKARSKAEGGDEYALEKFKSVYPEAEKYGGFHTKANQLANNTNRNKEEENPSDLEVEDAEKAAWLKAKYTDAAWVFREYLSKYPQGVYSKKAREKASSFERRDEDIWKKTENAVRQANSPCEKAKEYVSYLIKEPRRYYAMGKNVARQYLVELNVNCPDINLEEVLPIPKPEPEETTPTEKEEKKTKKGITISQKSGRLTLDIHKEEPPYELAIQTTDGALQTISRVLSKQHYDDLNEIFFELPQEGIYTLIIRKDNKMIGKERIDTGASEGGGYGKLIGILVGIMLLGGLIMFLTTKHYKF